VAADALRPRREGDLGEAVIPGKALRMLAISCSSSAIRAWAPYRAS